MDMERAEGRGGGCKWLLESGKCLKFQIPVVK